MESESDREVRALLKEAEKHCKVLLGRVAKPSRCSSIKSVLFISVGFAVGAAAIMSQNGGALGMWDQAKLSEMLLKHLPEMVKSQLNV